MNIIEVIESIEDLKQKNQYSEASTLAESALIEYADDYRLYEEIADIALFRRDFEKADAMITHALSLNPESGTGMYLAGYIAIGKQDFVRGIEFLSKANELFPNNAEILRNLWWAHFMLTEKEKWISLLRRAMNLAPNDDMIGEDLAVALISSGEIREGISILQKFQKEDRLQDMKNFWLIP